MKDRIDPLIAERAPWIDSSSSLAPVGRAILNRLLGYKQTLALAQVVQDWPSARIMDAMACMLAQDVSIKGLHNIPANGAALIVANHPTGIADGIILHSALRHVRSDTYSFANHDILRVLPQMSDRIAPVEWRPEKRSHAKTRDTMNFVRKAVADERLGLIFPSGRLAKRHGLRLQERPWMPSAAMLARKFDLPVIPVHIEARNSALFYVFDALHPTLRDITLFHETLNKAQQPFRLTIGPAISPASLPAKSEDGIEILRQATLGLGEAPKCVAPLFDGSRRHGWA